jgi:hypothetical protein
MPDEMAAERLFRVLVEVVLMEHANRRATKGGVELPPWLVPGLAARLEAKGLDSAILSPARSVATVRGGFLGVPNTETRVLAPDRPATTTRVQRDEAEQARVRLRALPALSVDQLNWPGQTPLDGPARVQYDASAHLCVLELLRLKDGAARLRDMLERLPDHLNWQVAFLEAFQGHFDRMIDVEKWWTLMVMRHTSFDPAESWGLEESRQRLDEVLYTPVQVRLEKDDLPHQSQVSLQTVLTEWAQEAQLAVLQQKLGRLVQMRPRLAPEVAALAEDYRAVIEDCLRRPDRPGGTPAPNVHPSDPWVTVSRSTISRLNQLNLRRQRLWSAETPASSPARERPRPASRRW